MTRQMTLRLAFFVAVLLVLPMPVFATPITYNYAGNSFTQFSTCNPFGIPDVCSATNIFHDYPFIVASITLDVVPGTAKAGMKPLDWIIGVGTEGLTPGNRQSVVYADSVKVVGCDMCTGSGGNFDVDEEGNVTGWTLTGRSGWHGTSVSTAAAADNAFWDAGLPYGAYNRNDPGVWTTAERVPDQKVSRLSFVVSPQVPETVPEPSALTLIPFGLAGVWMLKRKHRLPRITLRQKGE